MTRSTDPQRSPRCSTGTVATARCLTTAHRPGHAPWVGRGSLGRQLQRDPGPDRCDLPWRLRAPPLVPVPFGQQGRHGRHRRHPRGHLGSGAHLRGICGGRDVERSDFPGNPFPSQRVALPPSATVTSTISCALPASAPSGQFKVQVGLGPDIDTPCGSDTTVLDINRSRIGATDRVAPGAYPRR